MVGHAVERLPVYNVAQKRPRTAEIESAGEPRPMAQGFSGRREMPNRLADKVAIITGASHGQGAAEARLFAREGSAVVLTDVLVEDGRKVEAEIAEAGGNALFVELDVTSEEGWKRAVETTVQRFGKIDILVNNAGIFPIEALEDTTEQLWDRVLDINAKGVFLGAREVIPIMRSAGGGSIINISSTAGIAGSRNASAYHASKGAVRIFSKSAAIQYARDKIRVNSVHPGGVDTRMLFDIYDDEYLTKARQQVPMGRFAAPEEIAYAVLYLASDESSYVTGTELVVDGGFLAQ